MKVGIPLERPTRRAVPLAPDLPVHARRTPSPEGTENLTVNDMINGIGNLLRGRMNIFVSIDPELQILNVLPDIDQFTVDEAIEEISKCLTAEIDQNTVESRTESYENDIHQDMSALQTEVKSLREEIHELREVISDFKCLLTQAQRPPSVGGTRSEQMLNPQPSALTIREASEATGLHPSTLRQAYYRGDITGFQRKPTDRILLDAESARKYTPSTRGRKSSR